MLSVMPPAETGGWSYKDTGDREGQIISSRLQTGFTPPKKLILQVKDEDFLFFFLPCPHQDNPVITKIILKLLFPSTGFFGEKEAGGDVRGLDDEQLSAQRRTGFHP